VNALSRAAPHPSPLPASGEREGPAEREPPDGRPPERAFRGEGQGAITVGDRDAEPLAVYIHWPFCRSKCPYCDFNSHVRERVDAARWTRALLADLDHHAALVPGRAVGSVFFGGGTPSLMPPETVAALLDRVCSRWAAVPDLEVTLEANPNSAAAARFHAFAAAGINRLSLGVQALDPAALRMLGRAHDRGEAIAAIEHARNAFPRFSFDLIYARPGQTLAAWRHELDEALTLAGEHLSLYQLTIEMTQDRLSAHGLPAYEISNHARLGAECRHNLAYWRYRDYVGIGPGAHGRLTIGAAKHATRQTRLPERWLAAVEAVGSGIEEMVAIDRDSAVEEMLMMGLRLTEGVARARLERLAHRDTKTLFSGNLGPLLEGGFLTLDNEHIAATAAGRQRLNAVLAALLG
jgi:coproporphyrinogen III oxidase-like Fe-S oxidoreductase